MADWYDVTITVRVFDSDALFKRAAEHGRATGETADYVPGSVEAALCMLLDTGPNDFHPNDAGFEITCSAAEEITD